MVSNFVKIDIYIQARSGSTRLPKKSLLEIGGRSILKMNYDSCMQAYGIRNTVVLCPNNDYLIMKECEKHNIPYMQGPELDVMKRYAMACVKYSPTHFVRITADSPFINPAEITYLAMKAKSNGSNVYDMFTNQPTIDGWEVDLIKTSQFIKQELLMPPASPMREHVTMCLHQSKINIFRHVTPIAWRGKMSVDTENDYSNALKIYKKLWGGK